MGPATWVICECALCGEREHVNERERFWVIYSRRRDSIDVENVFDFSLLSLFWNDWSFRFNGGNGDKNLCEVWWKMMKSCMVYRREYDYSCVFSESIPNQTKAKRWEHERIVWRLLLRISRKVQNENRHWTLKIPAEIVVKPRISSRLNAICMCCLVRICYKTRSNNEWL